MNTNESRQRQTGGGAMNVGAGGASVLNHLTTESGNAQEGKRKPRAPLGTIPARLGDGGLILIGSQHVARVLGNELQRTLDLAVETYEGSILFRIDVLALARQAGARVAVCKDRASGDVYRASLDTFNLKGWIYNHPKYGLQSGLALAHWQRIPAIEPAARQLGMWEV